MYRKLYRRTLGFRKHKRVHLLELIKVKYLSDYIYELTFNNRVVKKFDFKNYLSKVTEKQAFFPLKENLELFRNAKLENGVLTWNDELDIAPEYLYIHGKTVNGKKEIRNMFQKPNGNFYWTWTNFKKASDRHKSRKFKMHPTVEIYFENVETAIIEKKYCNYVIRDDKVVQFSCYLNKIKPNLYDNKNLERIDYWRNVAGFFINGKEYQVIWDEAELDKFWTDNNPYQHNTRNGNYLLMKWYKED